MKIVTTSLALVGSALFVSSAMAVAPGKKVEYDTPRGKVIFDGTRHASQGGKCPDCHDKIFKMQKYGGKTAFGQMHKRCAACHDGGRAFQVTDAANCSKCHKKNPTPAPRAGS